MVDAIVGKGGVGWLVFVSSPPVVYWAGFFVNAQGTFPSVIRYIPY